MPLFEFSCRDCSRRFTFLVGVVADEKSPACPRCGSGNLHKLVSRVKRGRSDDERMDALSERMAGHDLDDPKVALALAREMGREIEAESGESLGGELEEFIDAEAGDETGGRAYQSSNGDDGTIY